MKIKTIVQRHTNIDINEWDNNLCGIDCVHMFKDSAVCTLFDDILNVYDKYDTNNPLYIFKRCNECMQIKKDDTFVTVKDYDYDG